MFNNLDYNIRSNIVATSIIISIVLIGYYKIFYGYDFWLYQDQLINSSWSYGNSLGNGWRPEKGFGISYFYSDPGAWHPWSPKVFLHKIFSSRSLIWNFFIIFHSILSAIAMFFLLRRVVPNMNSIICSLLCPLIVFTTSMDSIHFSSISSVSLIVVPLMLIILNEHYKHPKLLHFFLMALLFWYQLFFGSFLVWSVLPSLGLVFTILYWIYYKNSLPKLVLRYILLIFISTLGVMFLGAWEFYSIFLEGNLTEFARSKTYDTSNISLIPNAVDIFYYIMNLFNFYSIPTDITLLGPGESWRPFNFGWNLLPISSLIIIYFLFRRSFSFWEFSMKWLILIFYFFQLLFLIPLLPSLKTAILNILVTKFGYFMLPLINWYFTSWFVFVSPMHLALIAIFFNDIITNKYKFENVWGRRLQITTASILFVFFCGWLIFSLFSLFFPDLLPNLISGFIEKLGPEFYKEYPNYFLSYITWFNLKVLQNSIHWYSLLFYGLATLFIFSFLLSKKMFPLYRNNPLFISILLICGAIFYTWHVYPLNNHPLVWKEVQQDLPKFKPYDRFLYVGNSETSEGLRAQKIYQPHKFDNFKKKVEALGGPETFASSYRRVFKGGLHESPGLRLHGYLGFYQKEAYDFINDVFSISDSSLSTFRSKYLYGRGPVITSSKLDLAALSYYYSENELTNLPENLLLVYKKIIKPDSPIGLHIYKNLSAWPYFYLADTLEIKELDEGIKDSKYGSAYVDNKDFFQLSKNTGDSRIELTEFKYGEMIFDYYGDKDNFLVVADAWHPFWKAKFGNDDLIVVKANGIFKGVKLPPGNNKIILYFDTYSYSFGIYVSMVAWFLFIVCLVITIKYTKKNKSH